MRKYIEHIKEALINLFFAKLRTALALIGILVGSASVVAMVSGGELATREALKQFQSLGTDLLAMTLHLDNEETHNAMGKKNTISLEESLTLLNSHSDILDVAPYTQAFYPVYYHGQVMNSIIIGATGSFAPIANVKIKQGRFVSELDQYGFYCIIGSDLYRAIKLISFGNPLGEQLQINKQVFTIIGIAEDWPENNFVYANINMAVIIPLLTSTLLNQYTRIDNMIFRLAPNANIQAVEASLQQNLNRLVPDKNISFRSAKEILNKMKKQNDILTIFLGLIGSISLIVGGIGVMNIMLVSVIERRREIGVRLAVGATPIDICLLFLIEAILLSLTGGCSGVVIGMIITYAIAYWWQWQFVFLWSPPLIGFFVSILTGILSGFYPAYLAARQDPIVALRG